MKLIPLSQGQFTMVDDEDYDWLNQWRWAAQNVRKGNLFYAQRSLKKVNGKRPCVSMHRLIMGVTDKTIFVDHVNLNPLDNRKCNLRLATPLENARNSTSRKNSSSKYLGVHLHRTKHKYTTKKGTFVSIVERFVAKLVIDREHIVLGRFPNSPCGELLAALTSDIGSEKYFGEFANLNFKPIW